MSYVDGFVVAVPKANKERYIKLAHEAAEVFKRCGALSVTECWADDVPEGKLTSFPMAVKCEADEAVVFSWINWPSKQVRDQGMEQAMKDPWFAQPTEQMPFDGKRMIFGGFQVVVSA